MIDLNVIFIIIGFVVIILYLRYALPKVALEQHSEVFNVNELKYLRETKEMVVNKLDAIRRALNKEEMENAQFNDQFELFKSRIENLLEDLILLKQILVPIRDKISPKELSRVFETINNLQAQINSGVTSCVNSLQATLTALLDQQNEYKVLVQGLSTENTSLSAGLSRLGEILDPVRDKFTGEFIDKMKEGTETFDRILKSIADDLHELKDKFKDSPSSTEKPQQESTPLNSEMQSVLNDLDRKLSTFTTTVMPLIQEIQRSIEKSFKIIDQTIKAIKDETVFNKITAIESHTNNIHTRIRPIELSIAAIDNIFNPLKEKLTVDNIGKLFDTTGQLSTYLNSPVTSDIRDIKNSLDKFGSRFTTEQLDTLANSLTCADLNLCSIPQLVEDTKAALVFVNTKSTLIEDIKDTVTSIGGVINPLKGKLTTTNLDKLLKTTGDIKAHLTAPITKITDIKTVLDNFKLKINPDKLASALNDIPQISTKIAEVANNLGKTGLPTSKQFENAIVGLRKLVEFDHHAEMGVIEKIFDIVKKYLTDENFALLKHTGDGDLVTASGDERVANLNTIKSDIIKHLDTKLGGLLQMYSEFEQLVRAEYSIEDSSPISLQDVNKYLKAKLDTTWGTDIADSTQKLKDAIAIISDTNTKQNAFSDMSVSFLKELQRGIVEGFLSWKTTVSDGNDETRALIRQIQTTIEDRLDKLPNLLKGKGKGKGTEVKANEEDKSKGPEAKE